MDELLRVVLMVLGSMLALFLIAVGLLMWRYRIPPRGLVALGMAGFYLVSPIDVLPEALLGPLGIVDDAGIVGAAVLFAYRIARARTALTDGGVRFDQPRSGMRKSSR